MKKLLFLTPIVFISLACGGPENGGENSDGVETLEHRIFVTSVSYNGNLGGLSGADSKCKTLASNAGLTRNYKAIVSDDNQHAANRLTITGSIYKVQGTNKVLIADSAADLWDDSIFAPINWNENELSANGVEVWTGTEGSGTNTNSNCANWTSTIGSGTYGSSSDVTDRWIDDGLDNSCNNSKPLYCISQ